MKSFSNRTRREASTLKIEAGFSLVEVLIGTGLILLTLTALTSAYSFYLRVGLRNTDHLKAALLLQEGVEAATLMRDSSWSAFVGLTPGTAYHLGWNGTAWVATTTEILIDNAFKRTITLGNVYRRNSGQDIVHESSPDPKTLDSNTKKLTVRVYTGTSATTSALFTGGTTDGSLGSFPSNNAGDGDVAQSFTTGNAPVTASEAELFLKRVSSPSNVFLEIRSGSTVGTVLATSLTVASISIPSSALSWVKFTFENPPALSANTTYYLRLRSTPDSTVAFSGSSGTLNWGYQQTASSPYAGGTAFRYVGRLGNPSDQGQSLSQYDFAFKVNTKSDVMLDKQIVTYLTNLFE